MTPYVATFLITGLLLAAPSPAPAQSAAYTVTFETTWTAATHPDDYPANPHFSGLVGGTHDGQVGFWAPGELASLGIQRMAEWGSQAELQAEVQTAIDAGTAGETIAGAPLWTVPGSTDLGFTVTAAHPLVTLTAMVAPSPDWFVGVRDLDLRDGQGGWLPEVVVVLYPYDAGTDSGVTYGSPDQATVPPEPVHPVTGFPFTPEVPLGTFTFTLTGVSDVPAAGAFAATAFPNPFNPRTTIAWDLPGAGDLRIDVFDLRGRLVRGLRRGPAAAGPGSLAWNGRDAAGRPVRAGIYLARLVSPAGSPTLKMTLVK